VRHRLRFSLPFWLSLFLAAVYLLSFSGKFHVMDELAVFTAGDNLARHARADINSLLWTHHWTPNPPGIWGQDDNLYTKKAPGISFLVAPLLSLAHALPGLNAVHVGLLTNMLVTALTAALLFIWLTDLNFGRTVAALTTLSFGLGTIAWIYARMFWESSLLGLTMLGAVWAAHRAVTRPVHRLRWLLLSGVLAALGLTLRFEAAVAVLFIGLYLLWSMAIVPPPSNPSLRRTVSRLAPLLLFALPALFIGLALLWFNLIRYGSLSETGYTRELLFQAPWVGSYGLLFSPGRGLFLSSPLLLLLFWGLRPAWRRLPRSYFWLLAALCLFYWLFYGSWFAWGGTWGWGPRFLLPILPLLMLYVAWPLEWAITAGPRRAFGRAAIALLAGASLLVNLLGLAVDFNEYFLRLGRNDNFVFNWSVFPPLGHWQILQEGKLDIIWLPATPAGPTIEWAILLPGLLLLAMAVIGLILAWRQIDPPPPSTRWNLVFYAAVLAVALGLVFGMMRATAAIPLRDEQAQLDAPLLAVLAAESRPGDALLAPMPPFGDVQEITTRLMAYLEPPLPITAWIESQPRAVEPEERERLLTAATASAARVWLFERWLGQTDATWPTAAWLNAHAFPVESRWLEKSGRLTLYALPRSIDPAILPQTASFAGGFTLQDIALFDWPPAPGGTLKLRATWQAAPAEMMAAAGLMAEPVMVSMQLLSATGQTAVAQQDRLLLDLQQVGQSPLLPGETLPQGYGLALPAALPPGDYPLVLALYGAASGRRLPRADGSPDDFLYLTTMSVP
jgi:hypothetical protein